MGICMYVVYALACYKRISQDIKWSSDWPKEALVVGKIFLIFSSECVYI